MHPGGDPPGRRGGLAQPAAVYDTADCSVRLSILSQFLPKPQSAGYFDGWYADQAATPAVAEIMNRYMGFPPDTRAGVVVAEAIPELAEELRLGPGARCSTSPAAAVPMAR
jgi:hypothetical protein